MPPQTEAGAVVAAREDSPPIDTDEIRALTTAAGYRVRDELTQPRPEDPGTYFGDGKLAEIAAAVERTGARAVVVDGALTPRQTISVREAMPESTRVLDRYHLVLRLFAEQATTRRAQLQVELARLRYERPRIREDADPQGMNVALEKGTIVDGVENRIAELERKLASLPDPAEQHRQRRREEGFDLVTVAGYTNAGKSTLLHRLADELSLGDTDRGRAGGDATAAVEDRLFKTLQTTTRRATLDGRPALLTDTVGFVQDLPHWLVESFSATLSEAAAADAVVLVVDVTDPVDVLREKTRVSLDVLASQDVEESSVVTAVNKTDAVDRATRMERLRAIRSLAPAPVPVSVREGTHLGPLVRLVRERLPTETATLAVPNCGAAMELVSWAYDRTAVEDVSYSGTEVRIDLRGRPAVVEQARAKAAAVRSD